MKRSILVIGMLVSACGTDAANNGAADAGSDMATTDTASDTAADMVSNNGQPDLGGDDQGSPDMGGTSCNRMPRAANGPRKVVVAKPFTGTQYEVFDLSATGELSRPGVVFNMGESHENEIQFTPDGEVGFSVQDNGTLGVFRFNNAGQPEVLAAVHDPGFYVSGALIDPAGDYLYAWETGFRKNDMNDNGAMYRIPIGCATGMLEEPTEFFRGKLIRGAAWMDGTRMGVAADDLLDDESPNDAHLIDVSGPTRLGSARSFDYDDVVLGAFDVTADGLYMLVSDTSVFSAEPNRVGVIGVQGNDLFPQQLLEIPDPVRIITSPFNNAAIVLATTNDNIYVLDYNPGAAVSAFSVRGPLATAGASLLPLGAAMIKRGDLNGLVIVGENVAVRRLQFETNGDVTDLGILALGGGNEAITGAVGVQP